MAVVPWNLNLDGSLQLSETLHATASLPSVTEVADPNRPGRDWSRVIAPVAVCVWFIVTAWLCITRVYSPDEYESLHQAWLLTQGLLQYQDFLSNHPPLHFEMLRLIMGLSDDPVTLIRLGRFTSMLGAVILMIGVYRVTRDVFRPIAARWALVFFAINATLWEWAIEVRTDAILVPLWFSAVAVLLDRAPWKTTIRMAIVGCLLGLAFCTNQKAVLHSLPIGLFIMYGGPERKWKWWSVVVAVGASLIPTAIVFGRAAVLGTFDDLLQNNFLGGADWVEADPYAKFRTLTMRSVFQNDLGFALVATVALGWAVLNFRRATPAQKFVTLSAVWMLLTFFWTPGPFGYYMLSVFPMLMVLTGGFVTQSCKSDAPKTSWQPLAVALVLFCFFPFNWLRGYIAPTNTYQNQAIRLAAEMTSEETPVFDYSGALIKRPGAYRFHTRPTDKERVRFASLLPPLIPELKKSRTRLALRTDRVKNIFTKEEGEVLNHQFVKLWGPLYVCGYDSVEPVQEEVTEFELWHDGLYEVRTDGLSINGEPVARNQVLELQQGRHTAQLQTPGQRIQIVDASYRDKITLPEDDTDERHFLYKYWHFRYLLPAPRS